MYFDCPLYSYALYEYCTYYFRNLALFFHKGLGCVQIIENSVKYLIKVFALNKI